MSSSKHYGIVTKIVGDAGEGIGDLSVSALLGESANYPKARIVVGSTAGSPTDLGQFVLTYSQAKELTLLLELACADIAKAAPHAMTDHEDGEPT